MFVFDMSIEDNYASFRCDNPNLIVFVDSFGDGKFSVRVGNTLSSKHIGEITATSDEELNQKLKELTELAL